MNALLGHLGGTLFHLIDLRQWRLHSNGNITYLRQFDLKGRRLGVLELGSGLAEALKFLMEFSLLLSVFSDLSSKALACLVVPRFQKRELNTFDPETSSFFAAGAACQMDAADKSLLCHGLTPKLKFKSLQR